MRISDWSSDVCSSDLLCAKAANTDNGKRYAVLECFQRLPKTLPKELRADLCRGTTSVGPADCFRAANMVADVEDRVKLCRDEIGRASCRERVCQYLLISVVAVSLKTNSVFLSS